MRGHRAWARGRVWGSSLGVSLAVVLWSRAALAQRDLGEVQPTGWYVGHSITTVGSLALAAAVQFGSPSSETPRIAGALPFERHVESHFSPLTSRVSDVTLLGSLGVPVVAFASSGETTRFWNSALVYGETLSVSLALNTLTKHLVLRARPYTFHPSESAAHWVERVRKDRMLSFYSGHAAMSFTSAVAGGMVFSAGPAAEGAQAAYWLLEMSLAGFTAHARVRAGMHYTSDVLVGALVGAGIGVGVPLAHGVLPEISALEWGALAGGLVLGTSAALFLPTSIAEDLAELDLRIEPAWGGATVSVGSSW